jgi:hypothetical protein
MATRAQKFNNNYSLARFEEQAQDAENHAALVRQVLNGNRPLAAEAPPAPVSPAEEQAGASGEA